MNKENIVLNKFFAFSIRIVRLYQFLEKKHKGFALSKQILRSGPSIGANIEEGIGGLSKADFSARINIEYKECRETSCWLRLLKVAEYIDEKQFDSLFANCDELAKILFSIINSSRRPKKN